jgi:LemA protein
MEPYGPFVTNRTLVQIWAVIAIAAILGAFVVAYNATYTSVAELDGRAGDAWDRLTGHLVDRYTGLPGVIALLAGEPGPGPDAIRQAERRFDAWKEALPSGDEGRVSRTTADLEASLAPVRTYLEGDPGAAATGEAQEFLGALARTGDEIRADRQEYNDVADEYNLAVTTFPANLWADNWGFVPREYFMAKLAGE